GAVEWLDDLADPQLVLRTALYRQRVWFDQRIGRGLYTQRRDRPLYRTSGSRPSHSPGVLYAWWRYQWFGRSHAVSGAAPQLLQTALDSVPRSARFTSLPDWRKSQNRSTG